MARGADIISLAALGRVLVERATLAAFLANENERSIHSYAKRGLLVKAGHGRYKLLESVQNVFHEVRRQAAGRIGKQENVDAAKANADLKISQRELNELRIRQMKGELVSLPEVEAAWDEVALGVKQLFLSFPARARFDLPHLSGADQKVLEKLARDMLEELATEGEVVMPKKGGADGRAGAGQQS